MEVILALILFVWALMSFIALCCIWSNTGRTARALEELVQYQRFLGGPRRMPSSDENK